MNLQDYQGVYVFVQQVDNKITGVSFEPVSYTHLTLPTIA